MPPRKPSTNQRSSQRFSVRGPARLEPLDDDADTGRRIDIHLVDIGLCGVMFESTEPFESESAYRIRFYTRGRLVATTPVVIRHCEPAAPGSYRTGAQFMLEPFVLAALGVDESAIAPPAPSEMSFSESDFTAPE